MEHITLGFSSQSCTGGMRLPIDSITHVLGHLSPNHTSVVFIYVTPCFAASLCYYFTTRQEFVNYRKGETFNSFGLLAVVLQPVSASNCRLLTALCQRIKQERR